MKKLSFGDLTPELMKVLSKLKSPAEIIETCKEKDLEVSEKSAENLLEQFKRAEKLRSENLEKVAGGGAGYSGTKNGSQSLTRSSNGLSFNCECYCQDNGCWDCPTIYCSIYCHYDS